MSEQQQPGATPKGHSSLRTRSDKRQHAQMPARRALPPIRTLTVGPGISPGQPAAGSGRVADCNRRFGITPTPECAASGTGPVCHARPTAMRPHLCGVAHNRSAWTSTERLRRSTPVAGRGLGPCRAVARPGPTIGPYLLTLWSSPLSVLDQDCVIVHRRSPHDRPGGGDEGPCPAAGSPSRTGGPPDPRAAGTRALRGPTASARPKAWRRPQRRLRAVSPAPVRGANLNPYRTGK